MGLYVNLGIIAIAGAIFGWRMIQKDKKESKYKSALKPIDLNKKFEAPEQFREKSIWPGEDINERLNNENIVNWLKKHGSDPELWHFISLLTVPDKRNVKLYEWLVEQPKLDAASAAFLFHRLEGWQMLHYVKSEVADTEIWDDERFLIVKKIADRFEKGDFSIPRYTLMRLEDNVNPEEYQQIIKQLEKRPKKAPFKVPQEIFDYAVRDKVKPKYHYSDYHYNPYGEDIGTLIKLSDTELAELVQRY